MDMRKAEVVDMVDRGIDLIAIIEAVEQWSVARNLNNKDPKMQTLKLLEELGELARALLRDDGELIIDSLGDIFVVLIILHQQLGLDLTEVLEQVYGEIKDRTGQIVDGVFVKDE